MGAFLNSLTAGQLTLVRRRARGAKRPSYYNPSLAQLKADATRTGLANADDFEPQVQISEDLEGLLILTTPQVKQEVISFLREVIASLGDDVASPDVELLNEVLAQRGANYVVINSEISEPLRRLSQTRSALFARVEELSHQGNDSEAGSVVIEDLSTLFSAVASDYASFATQDILAVHDRIVDTAAVAAASDLALDRKREMLSWVVVFATYL